MILLPQTALAIFGLFCAVAAVPLDTPTATLTVPPNGHATRVGVRTFWTHGPDMMATAVPTNTVLSTRCVLGVPLLHISDDEADCEAWWYTNANGVETYTIFDGSCAASVKSNAYSGLWAVTGCWSSEQTYSTTYELPPPGETVTALGRPI
jgi:hypothetical protein